MLAFTLADTAQERVGKISGALITDAGQPLDQAQVEASEQGGSSPRYATSGADGFYLLNDLTPGVYNLKITRDWFRSAEIRDVPLDMATAKRRLPPVRLEIDGCPTDRGPDYYRPSSGAPESAAVGSVVISDQTMPMRGATVTLYMKGKGRIAVQKTTDDGTFRFAGIQVQSDEFWSPSNARASSLKNCATCSFSLGMRPYIQRSQWSRATRGIVRQI